MRLEEGDFHVYVGAQDGPAYGEGPAPGSPTPGWSWTRRSGGRRQGELSLADAVRDGRIEVTGEGAIAKVLREA